MDTTERTEITEPNEPADLAEPVTTWVYDRAPLRVARIIRGLTLAQAAKAMRVHVATWQRFEDGVESPRADDLAHFCTETGIRPATFFTKVKP